MTKGKNKNKYINIYLSTRTKSEKKNVYNTIVKIFLA